MKKFIVGKSYNVYLSKCDTTAVATIKVTERTENTITFEDGLFDRVRTKAIELDEDGNEKIFSHYCGVFAKDEI